MIKTNQKKKAVIPLCSALSLWWSRKPRSLQWCYDKHMVSIKAHFFMSGQCRFDVNNNAWALPCHQLTPLCVPMNSNWPQPRENAEAVLFRQAYCTSVCGPRLVHVRLFVGLSWPTSQCRTAPKVGRVVIGGEPGRRNYEYLRMNTYCKY